MIKAFFVPSAVGKTDDRLRTLHDSIAKHECNRSHIARYAESGNAVFTHISDKLIVAYDDKCGDGNLAQHRTFTDSDLITEVSQCESETLHRHSKAIELQCFAKEEQITDGAQSSQSIAETGGYGSASKSECRDYQMIEAKVDVKTIDKETIAKHIQHRTCDVQIHGNAWRTVKAHHKHSHITNDTQWHE